jgi:hypothetical protein
LQESVRDIVQKRKDMGKKLLSFLNGLGSLFKTMRNRLPIPNDQPDRDSHSSLNEKKWVGNNLFAFSGHHLLIQKRGKSYKEKLWWQGSEPHFLTDPLLESFQAIRLKIYEEAKTKIITSNNNTT